MFVGSNVFAITIADVERMGFEKAQQYLVKKYKAKNWDDLVYNKQATDMDAEDVETIKRLIEKREEIRKIANMKTNTIELEPSK